MVTTAATFKIDYYQTLPPEVPVDVTVDNQLFNNDLLKNFYQTMVLTRLFDAKAVSLQRTGQLGTYPSSLGQEAIGTAIGYALKPEDIFVTYYRDCAAQLLRGVRMSEILLYWGGSEVGNDYQSPKVREDLPNCVPMASQCLHAAGVATAMKIRQQKRVALVTCGDGGTSEGDFYETLNVAGTWKLPLVIVIVNNQWAISVRREFQTAAQTLAQKGISAGVDCEQVDGNDVISMYERLTKAIEKARNGFGPTVIEAITYRMSDHTTADDASRYRDKNELEKMKQTDPINRLKKYMMQKNLWSDNDENALLQNSTEQINQAVKVYLETPPEPLENIFKFHTHNIMPALAHDMNEIQQEGKQ